MIWIDSFFDFQSDMTTESSSPRVKVDEEEKNAKSIIKIYDNGFHFCYKNHKKKT